MDAIKFKFRPQAKLILSWDWERGWKTKTWWKRRWIEVHEFGRKCMHVVKYKTLWCDSYWKTKVTQLNKPWLSRCAMWKMKHPHIARKSCAWRMFIARKFESRRGLAVEFCSADLEAFNIHNRKYFFVSSSIIEPSRHRIFLISLQITTYQ